MSQELEAMWKILTELREIKEILIKNSTVPHEDQTAKCRVCGELMIKHKDGNCPEDTFYVDDHKGIRYQDGSRELQGIMLQDGSYI